MGIIEDGIDLSRFEATNMLRNQRRAHLLDIHKPEQYLAYKFPFTQPDPIEQNHHKFRQMP